jgi:carbon-monoxide dehydrogenase medium subunit
VTAFLAPEELDDALARLAERPAPVVLAGGTDLWPLWTSEGLEARPERVLSLHRLRELRVIEEVEGGSAIRIGAACTHTDLVRSELVRGACPAVAEAAATIGAIQVQNRGTIGGNIVNASPAADLPPSLMVADAEVELASASGGARSVALARFFTGYRQLDRRDDELLVAVRVPRLPDGALERFRKVGTRRAQAISKVVGACRLTRGSDGAFESAALAFGSVAPTAVRLPALERWLVGQAPGSPVAEEAERRAVEEVSPIDDLRSSAEYRAYVVGRLVRMWIEEL